jgi:hypothetical protein
MLLVLGLRGEEGFESGFAIRSARYFTTRAAS